MIWYNLISTQYTVKTILYISLIKKRFTAAPWVLQTNKQKKNKHNFCAQNFLFPSSTCLLTTVIPHTFIWWSIIFRGREKKNENDFFFFLLKIILRTSEFYGKEDLGFHGRPVDWKDFLEMDTTWEIISCLSATQSETLKPSPGGILDKNDHLIWNLVRGILPDPHVLWAPWLCYRCGKNKAILMLYNHLVPSDVDQSPHFLRSRFFSWVRHWWVLGDKAIWLEGDNIFKAFLYFAVG